MIGKLERSQGKRRGLNWVGGGGACFTKAQANDRSTDAQGESSLQQGLRNTAG